MEPDERSVRLEIALGRVADWHAQTRQVASMADFQFDLYADTKFPVDGRLFYEEPYFAVFEFALQAIAFLDADRGDWHYKADGMSKNPALSLTETASSAISISSPFEIFDADTSFAREDIKCVLIDFKSRLLRATLDDLGFDANWIFAR